MSLTFGVGASDDANYSMASTFGGNNRSGIVSGWWRPTTLTAGRKLWSAGSGGVYGVGIDTTTSELRIKTAGATTNGEWTTSGVNFTLDEWKFISVFGTNVNGAGASWKMWVTPNCYDPPAEVTITPQVTPVGNNSGGSLYVGNAGTGSLAFQGEVGWVVACDQFHTGNIGRFQSSGGTLQDYEADKIYKLYVLSHWKGLPFAIDGTSHGTVNVGSSTGGNVVADFSVKAPQGLLGIGVGTSPVNPITINGATFSGLSPPVPLRHGTFGQYAVPRR